MSHTPEPWHLRGNEIGKAIVSDDQNHGMMLSIAFVDKYDFEDSWEANARRIVACVNAFAGIPIEKFEGKSVAEFVTSQTMLAGMGPDERGGFSMQFEGGACALLVHAFAEQFKEAGAINYLEVNFYSDDLGPLSVTIQRANGKTPGQLKSEAIAQRDELLAAIKQSLDSMAAIIVDLADVQGVKLTKESVIKKSTNDSPVGVIRELISKIEGK